MPRRRTTPFSVALTAGAATGALLLGGCGGDATADPAPAPTPPATSAYHLLTPGTLTFALDVSYPPFEYVENGRPTGVDVELDTDLAHRLGLEPVFVNTPFDDLIATVDAGKADVISSTMTDRAGRQEKVDFVDYFIAGTQAMVAGGNPLGIAGASTWCGHRIATHAGTTNGDLVTAQSAACVAAGQAPVTLVDTANGQSQDAVLSGAADIGLEDYPSAVLTAAQSSGKVATAGDQLQPAPYGYGLAKRNTALRDALQRALQESIADGTYDAILKKYDVEAGALRTTALNGGA
ncbi:ABC transporter substrate-binding protein [Kineococcus rhizosphaerae]|uniref:Amino acid ABC transporter substrate-binding protein (PAAT family) n=1 Tax=Kineococcus rhizosphaerae TaxID=559628 RepID=A0A2T0R5J2_9ACTN|nr:ABC transporter substrate-binding protein [Kineococcus rhizosphaerae]PRY16030.1 amino acid ABC transporter substrate-binding protein (PAAT family) [Kineococcus rhizosphaerae]